MAELTIDWLPIAFVAPFLWAMVNVLDLYFIRGAYQDEWDGTLISGIFQLLPWALVLVGFVNYTILPKAPMVLALAGGCMFLASFFFYFRALFRFSDAVMIQILWNVAVLVVPVFAWFWSDERLQPTHYLGIALAFFGLTRLASREAKLRHGLRKISWSMVCAVLLMSASMVLQKDAYRLSGDRFLDVYLTFSLGVAGAAVILAITNVNTTASRIRRVVSLHPKNLALFVVAEVVSILGTLSSQRAIDLAPSATFVAAVESTSPVAVMLLSMIVALALSRKGTDSTTTMFHGQILGWRKKMLAVLFISSGIYCISV